LFDAAILGGLTEQHVSRGIQLFGKEVRPTNVLVQALHQTVSLKGFAGKTGSADPQWAYPLGGIRNCAALPVGLLAGWSREPAGKT
jgi:hypothetical protein